MNTVKVRNVVIGEGAPKICVSIVGKTKEEILDQAAEITELPADLAEWRADWFDGVFNPIRMDNTLRALREVLGELPLLFTFRTSKEGGEKAADRDKYEDINKKAAQTGFTDMIDVEAFGYDEATVRRIINSAHDAGVKVVASNHDFSGTPDKDEIIRRLCRMQALGADILKIAVMPQNRKDTLTLLDASEEMYSEYADRPIITMSMGDIGRVSRIAGELSGSAVTFGSASASSAPGQIDTCSLKEILSILHCSISD